MNWVKRCLIAAPQPELKWSRRYCILPTPFYRPDGVLRVYFASTDEDNIGRLGFVDLDPEQPERLLRRTDVPVLDAGECGAFDDCGVNPSCLVDRGKEQWLYYIGYQRTEKTPYLLFSGVAVSRDGGDTFVRKQATPILD